VGARVSIIQDASDYAKKALTIAIRYSAVRRQFPDPTYERGRVKLITVRGKQEEQIINYQSHQFRLMPLLATCFAYHFTSKQMKKHFEALQKELDAGTMASLAGVHATSAGLKAFSTWWCNEGTNFRLLYLYKASFGTGKAMLGRLPTKRLFTLTYIKDTDTALMRRYPLFWQIGQ
jgi:acyl-CoA oxidase